MINTRLLFYAEKYNIHCAISGGEVHILASKAITIQDGAAGLNNITGIMIYSSGGLTNGDVTLKVQLSAQQSFPFKGNFMVHYPQSYYYIGFKTLSESEMYNINQFSAVNSLNFNTNI